ncbi:MAG: isopentenyl-diphosphate Delta-isomerase [Bacteroidales bacterium]|nr:isopentenyl-diphosphate Delta-isomerase [Bacteroidales bacterium]
MNREEVVLVDKNDNPLGTMEKMQAHKMGVLHRAFSVFIYNSKGKMMIHRRALSKYHSSGLWTNACCSHPRINETVEEAAHRRLMEEMGFDCELKEELSFLYKADVGDGLIEHEFDHVFVGEFNGKPEINPDEVAEWKFINSKILKEEIKNHPAKFTEWFKIAFKKMD